MRHLPSLKQFEERHVIRLQGMVVAALRTISPGRYKNPKYLKYVGWLQKLNAQNLLVGDPEKLRRMVVKADTMLPNGAFWNPKSRCYDKAFAQLHKKLKKAFAYERFVDWKGTPKNPWCGRLLIKELAKKLKYCPYCNAETVYAFDYGDKLARSAFDHYFPRIRYPYLGLSLYNLIPACARCNTSFKGDGFEGLHDMAHPHVANEDIHKGMKFHLIFDSANAFTSCTENDVNSVVFAERHRGQFPKGVMWNNVFHVSDAYSALFKSDAVDIYWKFAKYPQEYLKALSDELLRVGLPLPTVERMVYGTPLDPDKINEHRFAKLALDIRETYCGDE